MSLHLPGTVNAVHDVGGRALAKAFHLGEFPDVVSQGIDVSIFAHPSQIDELSQGLLGDAVDVHALLGYEAGKLPELLGRTERIGAMERLGTTGFADTYLSRSLTYRALAWDSERSDALGDLNDLGYNLVRLDDRQHGARPTDAQSFTLADVAERGPLHGGALQFYRLEDGDRRDGACCARPFYPFQRGLRCLVLPLEGQACTGCMMSCDAACLGIRRVVVAYDESIDREGVLP